MGETFKKCVGCHRSIRSGMTGHTRIVLFAVLGIAVAGATSKAWGMSCSLKTGDNWSLRGTVTIQAMVKHGADPEKKETDSFFVRTDIQVKDISEGMMIFDGEVRRYPIDAQFWSEEKLADAKPLSRGAVFQKIALKGDKAGMADLGSTYLAPVVEDYFLPILLPDSPKQGSTYSYRIPLRNPMKSDSAWDATLTVKIAKIASGSMDVEYEYTVPEQSRKQGEVTVRFKAVTKSVMSFDPQTGRVLQRRSEQSMELSGDNQISRSEKVAIELRGLP